MVPVVFTNRYPYPSIQRGGLAPFILPSLYRVKECLVHPAPSHVAVKLQRPGAMFPCFYPLPQRSEVPLAIPYLPLSPQTLKGVIYLAPDERKDSGASLGLYLLILRSARSETPLSVLFICNRCVFVFLESHQQLIIS